MPLPWPPLRPPPAAAVAAVAVAGGGVRGGRQRRLSVALSRSSLRHLSAVIRSLWVEGGQNKLRICDYLVGGKNTSSVPEFVSQQGFC